MAAAARAHHWLATAAAVAPSSSSRVSSISGAAARPVDSVVLAVATLVGLLYEYTGIMLGGGRHTAVVLEGIWGNTGEWALQGSTFLIGG